MPDLFDEILADMDRDPFATLTGEPRMNARTPRSTPAPTRLTVTDVLDPVTPNAPAQLTKLGRAMEAVKAKMTVIEQFGRDVVDLIANNPVDKKYDLTTKEGEKACDDARKLAREKRLAIKGAWDEGKGVLRTLGEDLKVAAEKDITVLQAIEDNAKAQLTDKATKEAERKKRHTDNIAAIRNLLLGTETMSSAEVAARIQSMESVIVDDSYEEFEKEAKRVRGEVVDALTQAKAKAIEREAEARRVADAEAALQAEVAAAREKEERNTRIKARIQTIKDLPGQAEGTGAENIRQLLRIHEQAVPHADHYGDMLEFAEMAHELTTTKLKALLDQAVADDEDHAVRGVATDVVRPLDGKPLRGDDLFDPDKESTLSYRQEEDPFSEPLPAVTATTITVPDGAVGAPVPREVPRPRGGWTAAPAATVAPTPAPTPEPAAVTEDVPDLLQAAKDVIAFYAELPRHVMIEIGEPDCIAFVGAMAALDAAVAFISEFAD